MSQDPAAARFAIINLARLAGVAVVVIGLLMANGTIDGPKIAAYILIGVGLGDVFVVPQLLARKWRTPDK